MSEESQELEESVIAIGEGDKQTPGRIISKGDEYFFVEKDGEKFQIFPSKRNNGKITRAYLGSSEDGPILSFDYPKNESESEHNISSNEDDENNEEEEHPEEEDENDEEEAEDEKNQELENEKSQTNHFWMYEKRLKGEKGEWMQLISETGANPRLIWMMKEERKDEKNKNSRLVKIELDQKTEKEFIWIDEDENKDNRDWAWVIRQDKKQIRFNTRLDSLARILEARHTCASVFIIGDIMYVTTNKSHFSNEVKECSANQNKPRQDIEYLIDFMMNLLKTKNSSLKNLIKKDEEFKKDILDLLFKNYKGKKSSEGKRAVKFTIDDEEIKQAIELLLEDEKSEYWKYQNEIYKKFTSISRIKSERKEFDKITEFKTLFKDLYRDIRDFKNVCRYFKEKGFKEIKDCQVIAIEGEKVHTELRSLSYLLRKHFSLEDEKFTLNRDIYLGISKFCCPKCKGGLLHVNQKLIENSEHFITFRGSHSIEKPWVSPSFFQSEKSSLFIYSCISKKWVVEEEKLTISAEILELLKIGNKKLNKKQKTSEAGKEEGPVRMDASTSDSSEDDKYNKNKFPNEQKKELGKESTKNIDRILSSEEEEFVDDQNQNYNEKLIKAVGGGNCAFNAFILAGLNAMVAGELDLKENDNQATIGEKTRAQEDWLNLLKEGKIIDFDTDWAQAKECLMNEYASYEKQLELQSKLRQILREKAANHHFEKFGEYVAETKDSFVAAFAKFFQKNNPELFPEKKNENRFGEVDDIFIECRAIKEYFFEQENFVKNQIKQLNQSADTIIENMRKVLEEDWQKGKELAQQFIEYTQKEGVWVGDIELNTLAVKYGLSLYVKGGRFGNQPIHSKSYNGCFTLNAKEIDSQYILLRLIPAANIGTIGNKEKGEYDFNFITIEKLEKNLNKEHVIIEETAGKIDEKYLIEGEKNKYKLSFSEEEKKQIIELYKENYIIAPQIVLVNEHANHWDCWDQSLGWLKNSTDKNFSTEKKTKKSSAPSNVASSKPNEKFELTEEEKEQIEKSEKIEQDRREIQEFYEKEKSNTSKKKQDTSLDDMEDDEEEESPSEENDEENEEEKEVNFSDPINQNKSTHESKQQKKPGSSFNDLKN